MDDLFVFAVEVRTTLGLCRRKIGRPTTTLDGSPIFFFFTHFKTLPFFLAFSPSSLSAYVRFYFGRDEFSLSTQLRRPKFRLNRPLSESAVFGKVIFYAPEAWLLALYFVIVPPFMLHWPTV